MVVAVVERRRRGGRNRQVEPERLLGEKGMESGLEATDEEPTSSVKRPSSIK